MTTAHRPAGEGQQQAAAAHDPVTFTEAAALKTAELAVEENKPGLMLRVFITGGGCSGFQYGFTFDDKRQDDDMAIQKTVRLEGGQGEQTVTLLIDAMSFTYLVGATVDYQEDLQGSRFIIRNPNAKSTCGCGSSFSV